MVSRKLLPEHLKAKKRARKEEKKNSGVNVRDEQDREKMAKDRETADKIKRKLEAKARLYDQVHNGGEDLDDYLKENCLVDFDTKEGSSRDKNSSRSSGHEKERGRERERHISYQVNLLYNILKHLFHNKIYYNIKYLYKKHCFLDIHVFDHHKNYFK